VIGPEKANFWSRSWLVLLRFVEAGRSRSWVLDIGRKAGRSRSWAFRDQQKLGEVEVGLSEISRSWKKLALRAAISRH